MPVLDPSFYMADPQVKPFARQSRVDLTALDVPQRNEGEFIIYDNETKSNEIEVIHNIVPLAYERTDVGLPTESFQLIDGLVADGNFAYNPLLNGKSALVLEIDYNAPQNGPVANAPTNNERIKKSGITSLSLKPWDDAMNWNPLFSFVVPSESTLQVTFQILPNSQLPVPSPIGSLYQIPTAASPTPNKRVDFAGVLVSGVIMPQQMYQKILQASNAKVL